MIGDAVKTALGETTLGQKWPRLQQIDRFHRSLVLFVLKLQKSGTRGKLFTPKNGNSDTCSSDCCISDCVAVSPNSQEVNIFYCVTTSSYLILKNVVGDIVSSACQTNVSNTLINIINNNTISLFMCHFLHLTHPPAHTHALTHTWDASVWVHNTTYIN